MLEQTFFFKEVLWEWSICFKRWFSWLTAAMGHFPDNINIRPTPRTALMLKVFDDEAPQFHMGVAYGTSLWCQPRHHRGRCQIPIRCMHRSCRRFRPLTAQRGSESAPDA